MPSNHHSDMYKRCFLMWGMALCLCLCACKPGVPGEVIAPSDMEDLLYDYHLAQAMAEASHDSVDIRRRSYVLAVFDKYGVTEAEFDTSMIWYSSHATYLKDIYARIGRRLDDQLSALGASVRNDQFAGLDAQGDTANIWNDKTFVVLKPTFGSDTFAFSYEADSTFARGDVFMWRMGVRYISRGALNDAYAALYVQFDNDSTAGITRRLYTNNDVQLRITCDTALTIRRVGGFLYYPNKASERSARLMVAGNMMLVRMHRHLEPRKPDTLAVKPDSLLAGGDSAAMLAAPDDRRLTPKELRDSRPVEHSINVVKEKPFVQGTKRRSARKGGRR